MILPRPYQAKCVSAILDAFANYKSALAVLATGLGKTVIAALLARSRPAWRVLMMAHREELVRQAADKLQSVCGEPVGVEMAEERAARSARLVVASVQTLARPGRREQFARDAFDLLITDEAHHAVAKSYRDVIDHFAGARHLGITATPRRGDQLAMGQVYEHVAYDYGLSPAIDDGYLVPVRQCAVKVEGMDFSGLRSVAGDLSDADIERIVTEERILHAMAVPSLDLAGDRPGLVFCATVKHAQLMAAVLNRYKPRCAVALSGETPKDERREWVARYQDGQVQWLCNCLDEETEILTSDGWVGIDTITDHHLIANWSQDEVVFREPVMIHRRERRPGERMVVLETGRRSLRVTEDHAMIYRTYGQGRFLKCEAGDLAGRAAQLPISGYAQPFAGVVPGGEWQEPERSSSERLARIRANSYALRQGGMKADEARQEAISRIEQRDSLRRATPSELTEEECEFIGFWVGDGCRGKLSSGGIEYTLAQAPCYPAIVARIDHLLTAIGVDFIKRRKREGLRGDHFCWSMPRGTGFGPQQRRGLYRLEPYLQKDGTPLLWGLTCSQFAAFLRGLWMADGNHGDSVSPPETLTFCGTSRDLFDVIQAVACCRGYRVGMHVQKIAKSHHTPLIRATLRKEESHRMTKHRLRFEDTPWKPERVWCVTSHTGAIITRRKGTVTVTGQCSLFLEGFDAPHTSVVVMGRPTKSLALYSQVLGRGTRPLPGLIDAPEISGEDSKAARRDAIAGSDKPVCTVLDFVGNSGRHKIVTALDVLGGKFGEPVRAYAQKTIADEEKNGARVEDALERAEAELALLEEERRRIKARAVTYDAREVSPLDGRAGGGTVGEATPQDEPCSRGQAWLLHKRFGWNLKSAERLGRTQASTIITRLMKKEAKDAA